jgi:hypothetical protein
MPTETLPSPGVNVPLRFFSPSSPWNESPPEDAPLDPNSAQLVGALDTEVDRELQSDEGPSISTTSYSVPIYIVPAEQPTTMVRLVSRFAVSALRSAWSAVPLPPAAVPAAGTDGHLVVWQPSTDRLWEFWRLQKGPEGWHASWGGAIQNVSSSSGVYGPQAWPGATTSWGASASGLSIAGGLITLEDLQAGTINHALALGIPDVRAGTYSVPAERTDGSFPGTLSLPEGAHLRLDPHLDLAALHLPPLTLMIAEAAQRYGIIVRDGAGSVTFYAQDPTPTGKDPYRGPTGYFEGTYPAHLLAAFPWSHLQLLEMHLSK